MSVKSAIVSIAIVVTGCYGAAPPKPVSVPVPPLSDGATIEVHSEAITTFERVNKQARTCADDGSGCITTKYEETEPITRTHSRVTYGGQQISVAQLHIMSDADREQKLARLEALSHTCQRANIPRYVGIGMLLGGAILAGSAGENGAMKIGGAAAMGVGIGSYALGYVHFGGRDCNVAKAIYMDVDVSTEVDTHEVVGVDAANALHEMASRFNTTRAIGDASAMRMR
ncbi:MAG: hypothetical protein AB7O24_02735 [Kofleriaceae bacterium]